MSIKPAPLPGSNLKVECVANGTFSIESEYDMALAQPEVMRLIRDAEVDGADACMITCFGDPGGAGAKELVSIPVVGEGEAALHMASLLGGRFTIMITQRELFPMMRKLSAQVGMEGRLASVRAVGAGVLDFGLDCVPAAVDQAVQAVEDDGAEVIVMGCTGTGVDMAAMIEESLKQRVGAYVPGHRSGQSDDETDRSTCANRHGAQQGGLSHTAPEEGGVSFPRGVGQYRVHDNR